MIDLGVACDGGKDSLSMAAAAGGEVVMCPGNLVVSAYVGCPDITQVRARLRPAALLLPGPLLAVADPQQPPPLGRTSSVGPLFPQHIDVQVVTPDLKLASTGKGVLVHVDLGNGRRRLGGSALAQVRAWPPASSLCASLPRSASQPASFLFQTLSRFESFPFGAP